MLGDTFEHDIATSLQHYDQLPPEHKLLIAIITRSILDYLDDTAVPYNLNNSAANYTKGRAKWEADQFFFPPEVDSDTLNPNKPPPFSFFWIAQHLSDDPEGFMASVRQLLHTAPTRSAVVAQYGRYAPGRITGTPY
jgi:hypothetical protein